MRNNKVGEVMKPIRLKQSPATPNIIRRTKKATIEKNKHKGTKIIPLDRIPNIPNIITKNHYYN